MRGRVYVSCGASRTCQREAITRPVVLVPLEDTRTGQRMPKPLALIIPPICDPHRFAFKQDDFIQLKDWPEIQRQAKDRGYRLLLKEISVEFRPMEWRFRQDARILSDHELRRLVNAK